MRQRASCRKRTGAEHTAHTCPHTCVYVCVHMCMCVCVLCARGGGGGGGEEGCTSYIRQPGRHTLLPVSLVCICVWFRTLGKSEEDSEGLHLVTHLFKTTAPPPPPSLQGCSSDQPTNQHGRHRPYSRLLALSYHP